MIEKRILRLVLLLTLIILPLVAQGLQHGSVDKERLLDLQTAAPSGRIILKFAEDSGIELEAGGLISGRADAVARVKDLLNSLAPVGRLERHFSRPAAELRTERRAAEAVYGGPLPDLNLYASFYPGLPHPDRTALMEMLRGILSDPAVESAWLEPVVVPAALGYDVFTGALPQASPLERDTPDFSELQGYLENAPTGVGAWSVASVPGSDGPTVRVVDVEGAWLWTHEDLPPPFFETGGQYEEQSWRNHGTAVLGVMRGGDNGYGVRGIAPACSVGCSSIAERRTADAISTAVAAIEPGDIVLIELHAAGPVADGNGQYGYMPMEFWQDIFDVLLFATLSGRIVCEAAGNGEQDLDDPLYAGLFDRNLRDSGAIMIGASIGEDLNPAPFTNYGTRLDLHGWGYNVTSCGYGGLQGPPLPEEEWYTNSFSGTSSASPIVVGAVASLQGMVEEAFNVSMDADLARFILRQTGTPQEGEKLIGPRPDLVAAWSLVSAGIGGVQGRVSDAETGLPLESVLVELEEMDHRTMTAADGLYDMPLLAGDHTLVFHSFFHADLILPLSVSGGEISVLDAALVPLPTVSFSGTVVDTMGAPLPEVRVSALETPLSEVLSGSDGAFELSGVPEDLNVELLFDHLPGHGVNRVEFGPAGTPPPLPRDVARTVYLVEAGEDFEEDEGGFSCADGAWTWGAPAAGGPTGGFSGERCWGVGMEDDYANGLDSKLLSPVYDFSGADRLRLSFHYWSETIVGWDGVNLEVEDEFGWTLVEPEIGYTDYFMKGLDWESGWSGFSQGWQGTLFDMTEHLGPEFRFRLTFGSTAVVNGPGFWIDDISFDTGDVLTAIPVDAVSTTKAQMSAWPNPFNPATTLRWRLPGSGHLKIEIFDARGRRVRALVDQLAADEGQALWDGRDDSGRTLASGLYLARLELDCVPLVSRRLVLIK